MASKRTVAIMQPYFLPYIGYWQLMQAADVFVVYDNIEYTKKGWINRNRMLCNGQDRVFTLPLRKDHDSLHVCQRYLSDTFEKERGRLIRQFDSCYRKAPCVSAGMGLLRKCLHYENQNLFNFIFNSIELVKETLGLRAELCISSTLDVDPALRGEDRVLRTCQALGADTYINPIGGQMLYSKSRFQERGINLYFQNVLPYTYEQGGGSFVPHLSIIDVMMFNDLPAIQVLLGKMELI